MNINGTSIPSMTDVFALFTPDNILKTLGTREGAERAPKCIRAAVKAILETQRFMDVAKSLFCVQLVTVLNPLINGLGLYALVSVAPSLWSDDAKKWTGAKTANRVLLVAGLTFNNLAWAYEVGLAPILAPLASKLNPIKDGFIFCSSIAGVWSNYQDLQKAKNEGKATAREGKVAYINRVRKWEGRLNRLAQGPDVLIPETQRKYTERSARLQAIDVADRTAKQNEKLTRYAAYLANPESANHVNLANLIETKIAFYKIAENNRQMAIDKAKTGMWSDGGKVAIIGAGNLAMLSGYGAMYKTVALGIAYLSLAVEYIGEVKATKEVVYHKKADLPAMPRFVATAAAAA